jgi:hypothetical protein
MRGKVFFAQVGFDFHDAPCEPELAFLTNEDFSQKFTRHAARIAGEKGAREWTKRSRRQSSHSLDRLDHGTAGFRYVGGFVVERFAGLVGELFVLRSDFSDGIVPAIVPGDAGLAVDERPCAVSRT